MVDCLKDIEGGEECMTAVNAIQASMEDLLDKSKVCDKKAGKFLTEVLMYTPANHTLCSLLPVSNIIKEFKVSAACFVHLAVWPCF